MKKYIPIALAVSGAYLLYREYIHAIDYIYRLCLCRGSKAFLFNCNNISNELNTLFLMKDEIENVKRWCAEVKPKKVYIRGASGRKVYLRVFGHKESRRWAVAVHGYGCNGRSMLACAKKLYEGGYNVVVPDLPCHGGSGGSVTGLGQYEHKDIIKIARRIAENDSFADIMLYGVSMGAATVLMASGSDELPENVSCIISDCSFTAAKDIFSFQISGMFRVPTALIINSLDKMYRKRTGLSFKDADAVRCVSRSKTPILFIHGSKDNIVPTYMVYELYNAASCSKEIEIIKGAGHGVSAYTDSENYWKRVFSFAERHERYY